MSINFKKLGTEYKMLWKALLKKKREHLITMQVLSSLYANGTSLLCLWISKKTPNMAFVVLTLQAHLRSGSEWCPEQLRSCSNPQAEHLSVSHIARHLEISCKVECWMFNNHPELFFLNFWKQFPRQGSLEGDRPKAKQAMAASSSSRRTQLPAAEHHFSFYWDGTGKIQYF